MKANHLPRIPRLFHHAVVNFDLARDYFLAPEPLPKLLQQHLLPNGLELLLFGPRFFLIGGVSHSIVLVLLDGQLRHPVVVVLIEVLLAFDVQLAKDLRGRQRLGVRIDVAKELCDHHVPLPC